MMQRLHLHRIHTEPARPPIGGEHDLISDPSPHETQPPLTLVQPTRPRTHIALDTTVLQPMPIVVGTVHGSSKLGASAARSTVT